MNEKQCTFSRYTLTQSDTRLYTESQEIISGNHNFARDNYANRSLKQLRGSQNKGLQLG